MARTRQWRSPVRTSKIQEIGKSGNREIGKSDNRERIVRIRLFNLTTHFFDALGVLAEKRQGQCCIFSSTAVIAMNEKRIHPKTAIREAKSDTKKEERIGSVMDEINERRPLQEPSNAPWPPRVSSGATSFSSASSTLPGSRTTCVPPDLKEIMQLASWVSMLSDFIRTESDPDSWYVAARRRATTLLQCKESQWHELQTRVTRDASRWMDEF